MPAYVPRAIARMMAQREMRMHHYLWHTVRDTWLFLDKPTQDKIRNLGWEPPRPALKPSGPGRTPIHDNASGEDFFFMHRQMIASVNAVAVTLNDSGFPRVEGWRKLPLPNDVEYPVPPSWDTGDADLNSYLQETKSDAFFEQARHKDCRPRSGRSIFQLFLLVSQVWFSQS